MFSRMINFITLRPYIIAIVITVSLLFWMLSPVNSPQSKLLVNNKNQLAEVAASILPKVQTTHYVTQSITKNMTLYGKSEANSRAVIRAEVAGKIIKVRSKKGTYIKENENLANIEKSELPSRLKQAEANLTERELTYKAVKSLNDKGLQSRVRLAEVNSLLLSAKTDVEHLALSLKRTNITAPISGLLQEQFSDVGDYVQIGDPIFRLENTDPIVIRGDATEHHINKLKLGQTVSATLLSGDIIEGKLSYIASIADNESSTFRIEAEFPNPNLQLFSGISAKLTLPLYQVDAIYVSPSSLAMDDDGNLGVKTVKEGIVVFHAIQLVETDHGGAWLSGFDNEVDIITLGQGFVKAGDRVNAIDERDIKQPSATSASHLKGLPNDALIGTDTDTDSDNSRAEK